VAGEVMVRQRQQQQQQQQVADDSSSGHSICAICAARSH
jgi:hypothetical protein